MDREEIIQFLIDNGHDPRSRSRRLVDIGDNMMALRSDGTVTYAGERLIELVQKVWEKALDTTR